MHNQLKQIYEDVRAERISKDEALKRVRAFKGGGGELALMVPSWQQVAVPEQQHGLHTEHVLVLCGTAEVNTGELTTLIPADRCVVWPPLPEADLAGAYATRARACLQLVQEMLGRGKNGQRLLQVVVADTPELGLMAGLAALLKTARQENPQFAGQLILVDAHTCTPSLARLLAAEASAPNETLVRHRHGRREVLRWQLAPAPTAARIAFKEDGVYLITGGLGGLGLLFAGEILRQTRRARVVLTGRAPLSAKGEAAMRELDAEGARLAYRQLDLGSRDAVTECVSTVAAEYGKLNGVLHAAGQIADQYLVRKLPGEFDAVLAPKVAGTLHLAHACEALEPDFVVLFSSIAGALGNACQADYAAANGFMDQFAAYGNARLSAQGRKGRIVSVNWSLWQDGGMQLDADSMAAIAQQTGLQPLQTGAALRAFHLALAMPGSQCLATGGANPVLRRWIAAQDSTPTAPAAPAAHAPGPAGHGQAEQYLCKVLSGVLKLAPNKIDVRAPLEQYGIDSILAMKLTAELEKSFGPLSKTLFFEYQSIAELAVHFGQVHAAKLAALHQASAAPPSPPAPPPRAAAGRTRRLGGTPAPAAPAPGPMERPRQNSTSRDPIAIVGLSGRYPESPDVHAFWDNLRAGRDCVTEVPASRWNWRDYYSEDRTLAGHHYSRWGGFIEGVDEFDPQFFNIAPREAKLIDPQERLFLQHAWLALEDAGYTRAALETGGEQPGEVGVYAGVMYSEYQMYGVEASMRGQRMGLNGSTASIANRVSYFLNLHGPSMTLDTMCSSSLTALHLACQDLRSGRISAALAGGVNVSVHPNKYLLLSSSQFISSAGQCQSFGEGGNGYIPGEGVGVVMLKRLSDAERDGDHIYGTIRGSALSHGGKTNGISVPNPRGQANAVRRALQDAGVEPGQISYIEAHGTGTKLGDPIEIAALHAVFQPHMAPGASCLIGSVKSNIGHCESAAGIAALTKVLLQMKHRQIVPSLHSTRLNPNIDFAGSPFEVNQSLREWSAVSAGGMPPARIAGISSFGAGGSNTHVVIEEYVENAQAQPEGATMHAVLLSARTPEQLTAKALSLLEFVQRTAPDAAAIRGIAYTLQTGRESMDERLSVMAASAGELADRLRAWIAGEEGVEGVARNQARRHREALSMFGSDGDLQQMVRTWVTEKKLPALVDLWGKGVEVDWRAMYGATAPRRVSLPLYPFARERYWVEAGQGNAAANVAHSAALHPLVHANTSTLEQHGYASRFNGTESFFATRGDERVLPEAALLEMARAALTLARGDANGTGLLEVRGVRWGEPFVAQPDSALQIALLPAGADTSFDIFSGTGARERVHCQGMACTAAAAPRRLDPVALRAGISQRSPGMPDSADIRALFAGQDQWLMEFSVNVPEHDGATVTLRVLEAVTQAVQLASGGGLPCAVQSARFAGQVAGQGMAWIRLAGSSDFDIDIADEQGEVALELRGLVVMAANRLPDAVPAPAVAAAPVVAVPVPLQQREIIFVSGPVPAATVRAKPDNVTLPAPAAVAGQGMATRPRVRVALSDPAFQLPAPGEVSPVRLFDQGGGIFLLHVVERDQEGSVVSSMVAALATLSSPDLAGQAKILLLFGAEGQFLSRLSATGEAAPRQLYAALVRAPFPIIAVLPDGAAGAGFIAAAMCDFMICAEDAQYGCAKPGGDGGLAALELALVYERFGAVVADHLVTRGEPDSGRALQGKGLACAVVPAPEVQGHAEQLAKVLAAHTSDGLRLLKLHLARRFSDIIARHPAAAAMPVSEMPAASWPEQMPLAWHADGIALVQLNKAALNDTVWITASEALKAQEGLRALVLACAEGMLWSADEAAGLFRSLKAFIAQAPVPVVVALEGEGNDGTFMLALLADACVISAQAHYGASPTRLAAGMAGDIAPLLAQRFGDAAGKNILLTGARLGGTALQALAGRITATERAGVITAAVAAARALSALPPAALAPWRDACASAGRVVAAPIADWVADAPLAVPDGAAPVCVPLASGVVAALAHPGGILEVRMEDRRARNMFSDELVAGMNEVFRHVASSPGYKVVILTGYDRYFASGGTKENLLAIQAGSAQFTDSRLFELPLRCPVPVISAMQGHGIGAGWSLGMYADFTLFSERGEYSSPYMAYGFTPGAGATLVFPERIGYDLARETMLTGQQYSGAALRRRGLCLPVLEQGEVAAQAMALALQIASLPRSLLVAYKSQLAEPLRLAIDEVCALELEMHAQTFVGRADTLQRIEERFAQAPGTVAPQPQAPAMPAQAAVDTGDLQASLKALLAQELQMAAADIDDDMQFVDLGLDSVSGVTWVRKINEQFGIALEATQIYSYPTLKQFASYVRHAAGSAAPVAPAPVAAAASVAAPQAPAAILDSLAALLADELQMRAEDIDEHMQFVDLGLDSVSAVTWMRKINALFGTDIEATQIYSFPTLHQLAQHVRQVAGSGAAIAGVASPGASTAPASVPRPSRAPLTRTTRTTGTQAGMPATPQREPIAVVGMAGQFPQAGDIDAFWRNIAEGRDCISEIPSSRWDSGVFYQPGEPAPGKTNSRWLGAMADFDCFDPLFFNISPSEAESMDPQQRLFLQASWHAIEHAGYDAADLSGSRCGVFVGCAGTDYHQRSGAQRLSAQGFTGAANSILAARISYFLNLQGPGIAIDTACSSSLVAIAQACDSLVAGTIDAALAGGVYVMTGPDLHIQTAQAGMLSTDGRCFTFDQRANGFVPGEAVATIMLKRLSDAERDGDTIHGVIRGWGVNQDGKTNGITAPNPQAQAALQRDVYSRFGIDPSTIGLIEAHGTGTKLGDPIEVQALKQSFGLSGAGAHCALGSVKSNIGHCLTAAGATGFIKLVQALKHRQLPPTIHFDQLNEHINLAGSPFYINAQLRPWQSAAGVRRRAAISSFGFSGTNAHLVLEEYHPQTTASGPAGPVLVPLSARTPEQLRQRAQDLLAVLSQEPAAFSLAELAFTLQLGRTPMEHRLLFSAASAGELAARLAAWLQGAAPEPAGDVAPQLAAAWLAGAEADWASLYAGRTRPRRIALPLYPFARERYWIAADVAPALTTAPVRPAPTPAGADGTVLLPRWQDMPAAPQQQVLYDQHVLVLCGTVAINTGELTTLVPAGRCVVWPALDAANLAGSFCAMAQACHALVRDMLAGPGRRLLQIVAGDTPELGLVAGLAGMLKTAAQENPRFAGQVITVDAGIATPALARLLASEAATPRETLVRYRDGRRQALRWQAAPSTRAPIAFREHGTYLITGGMGALGRLFAGEILRQARHAKVILAGRGPLSVQGQALLRDLGGDAGRVSYRQLDLSCEDAVRSTLADIAATHGRLDGILHAAGQTADQFIIHNHGGQMDAVLAPKVAGTLHLAGACDALDLDFLVLFSSIAGALGNAGQADYAAANGFMDQFAALRTSGAASLTVSINWSLWQDGGMRPDAATLDQLGAMTGMRPLSTAAGMAAFHQALALGEGQCMAVAGDVAKLLQYVESGAAPAAGMAPRLTPSTGLDRLLAEQTLLKMKELFGAVIKLAPGRIDANKELSAYGIDSLMVTRLNGEFAKVFGAIAKTLVFEYKTLAALSAYFVEHHRDQCQAWTGVGEQVPQMALPLPPLPPLPVPAMPAPLRASTSTEPIAIVGVSGTFPQAESLAQFWDNLRSGLDCVGEVPAVRWPQQGFYEADMMRAVEQGKSYSKWGGFVEQFDQFDPLFFGIAPSEAMSMDPQERMFLQAAWHCMESAGYTRADLRDRFQRKVGVFAGITRQGYNLHGTQSARRERKFHPHTSFGSLANRLSYLLDITGPSMPIDTMCSSSLTAIHEACEQIRRGDCALAFAGAVNLYTHPSNYVDMASQYALSPDGRCRSFGAGANGFVPGEGVGVLLLRPLSEALADGDVIHGLILGTHVNHGGRTNGYTVPSPRAQAELIAHTISKAGIDARDISYVEAHGTGTALGDPIEIEGLRQAFARDTGEAGYCRIGSAKSNIGHLEAAAGMAGMAKILLQMKHRQLAPSLHAAQLNPAIDFSNTPFVVNTALAPWNPVAADGSAQPRIAAISAFGAGGANAHVIVKEFDPAAWPRYRQGAGTSGPVLVPLSAKSAAQLRESAVRLLAFIDGEGAECSLASLAYTLQTGREAMEQRAGFVASSLDGLAAMLRAYLAGDSDVAGCYAGQVEPAGGDVADMLEDEGMRAAVSTWLASGKLGSLARWWCRGLAFDWHALYPQGRPNRMVLPGYPFARERYWVGPGQAAPQAPVSQPAGDLGRTIDDIVSRIDSDAIDSGEAVELLDAALRRN
ncbi:SDR family NAD(P)-dependent oxidoreductase [Massilia sp. PAMC28688]|uniref:SDR family NAD(P)-dependent oxidoreductase n=1 Tax=Massilia sp. PAMC28688 TaxID=2861283 RepID=UPI001C63AE27|nr:SDR family NAD(P)-dependent oxidoreductase [Massilia sp. PAMC28688]QYF93473.1 SDR family NAD(P)-dependent oxidoreductase [Massilia sp. PAMC28688]